jgi:hypothetical protein
MTVIKATLHGDQNIFLIISGSVLLRFTKDSEKKICRENQNTYFMSNSIFENRDFSRMTRKKYRRGGQNREDNILTHLRTVCWITKATNTHSECVILSAFPL